jgi:L-threonylcarbamoyladenylate synthase
VHRILALKGRPAAKGLILIAGALGQLEPYITPLTAELAARVLPTWPGPLTWLLPVRPQVPVWLHGAHATLAVRVSAHPQAAALCHAFGGAIVSTSANPSGRRPARSALDARRYFGGAVDYYLHGAVDLAARPTAIRDGLTGRIMRPA